MQQICALLGRYEDLAEVSVKKSLKLTNKVDVWREGNSRRPNSVNMDAVIVALEQAGQLYAQVPCTLATFLFCFVPAESNICVEHTCMLPLLQLLPAGTLLIPRF